MFILVLFIPSLCLAEIQSRAISYQHGDVQLEGFLAWDDARTGKRPGVLVVHEWWGLNEYARDRARQLAALGYAAFAVDMYGKGQVTTHPDQAATWMKQVQSDVKQWQDRALKGLAVLQSQEMVDPQYALRRSVIASAAPRCSSLVYSGADVKGVVSFHGALPMPTGKQAQERRQRKSSLLTVTPIRFSPKSTYANFAKPWMPRTLDWQMVVYAGARHSFTNPGADAHGIDALKYNRQADMTILETDATLF